MDRFLLRRYDSYKKRFIFADIFTGVILKLCDGNYPIEQSTGLKDKNGKLIYEGILLRILKDI